MNSNSTILNFYGIKLPARQIFNVTEVQVVVIAGQLAQLLLQLEVRGLQLVVEPHGPAWPVQCLHTVQI